MTNPVKPDVSKMMGNDATIKKLAWRTTSLGRKRSAKIYRTESMSSNVTPPAYSKKRRVSGNDFGNVRR